MQPTPKQRRVLVWLTAVLLVMLAYPPFYITYREGIVSGAGYAFLLEPPDSLNKVEPRVDVPLHLLQLVGVSCVGALAYLIAGQPPKE